MNRSGGTCELPDDLYYLVEHHVWARPEPPQAGRHTSPSPLITVGVTDVFQALSERIMFFTPRRIGRDVEQGDPIGVVESGKWLGMIASPIEGEIVEYNPSLSDRPTLLNTDPYGTGWVARLRAADAEDLERQGLVTGPSGVAFYRSVLEAGGINCLQKRTVP